VAVGVSLPDEPLVIVDARLRPSPSTLADASHQRADRATPEEHIWILTHAGDDPMPTPSDEDVFGILCRCTPWAVLCVLTPAGRHAARLEFQVGPGGPLRVPVCLDLSRPFAAADHTAWDCEFAAISGPLGPPTARRRPAPPVSRSPRNRERVAASSPRRPDA
jgi:hypothetical protein